MDITSIEKEYIKKGAKRGRNKKNDEEPDNNLLLSL